MLIFCWCVAQRTPGPSGTFQAIFALLSGRQVQEAVKLVRACFFEQSCCILFFLDYLISLYFPVLPFILFYLH